MMRFCAGTTKAHSLERSFTRRSGTGNRRSLNKTAPFSVQAGIFFRRKKNKDQKKNVFTKNEEQRPEWGSAPTLQISAPILDVNYDIGFPTLPWLAKALPVGLEIVMNYIANRKADFKEELGGLTPEYLIELAQRSKALIDKAQASIDLQQVKEEPLKAITQIPQEDLKEFVDLLNELKQVFGQIKSIAYEKYGQPDIAQTPTPNTISDYKDLFRVIDLPEIANNFDTDETFAKMRIAGPNPTVLTGVTHEELIAMIGDRLTDEQFNEALGTSGDSVKRAGNEGRLCVSNYKALRIIDKYIPGNKKIVTMPVAVFAEPLGGIAIKPVVIQLGQDTANSELVFSTTTDTYRWNIAKTLVHVADFTHHELIAHLGHTHLVSEAFSVATWRNLEESHPLHRLLAPHFEGTNFINRLAATDLINTDGPIDDAFAGEQDERLESLQILGVAARYDFDFKNQMPDVELKARKVDRLKLFPYRDDCLLLWEAIGRWTKDYVELYYDDDQEVAFDQQLAQWSLDVERNGFLKNFEAPKTRAQLARVLAMVIFVASVQHAAVNFPQSQYMSFAPAFLPMPWAPLPEGRPATETQYLQMLPPMDIAEIQLAVVYLLGSVYHYPLGEYKSNQFPYFTTLQLKANAAQDKFKEELESIQTIIENRNKERGEYSYEFLLPRDIPASINI